MVTTRVCQILGVRHPIVQAGMAAHTSPGLVAAVSNAGGLGLIGSVFRPVEDVADAIRRTREKTDRPFGVNIVLAEPHADLLDLVLRERVAVISTSWGDPGPVVERAAGSGIPVMHQVETVREARAIAGSGVDLIVAQGGDGGGHVGKVGTFALVPAVKDVVGDTPVLAAGGIADGRGLAAAIALGAEGALIGTRFLATDEAPIPDAWKRAILNAAPEDAWASDVPDLVGDTHWPGATVRVLANDLLVAWYDRIVDIPGRRDEINRAIETAEASGDVTSLWLYAGQSAGLVYDIPSAGELVERIVRDATEVLARIAPSVRLHSRGAPAS